MRKLVYRILYIVYRKSVILIFALLFLLPATAYQPPTANAQTGAQSACASAQRRNDFIRECTAAGIQNCNCEYRVIAWCDGSGFISTDPPPKSGEHSVPNFVGYGGTENICNLAPTNCVPRGSLSIYGQGSCEIKPTTQEQPTNTQEEDRSTPFTMGDKGNFGTLLGAVRVPPQLQNLLGRSGNPDIEISNILSRFVELLYMGASLIFVLYFLWSSIEFIYSQGNKEQIAEARGRITWAIIGIFILALTFVLLKVLSQITGFKFFS